MSTVKRYHQGKHCFIAVEKTAQGSTFTAELGNGSHITCSTYSHAVAACKAYQLPKHLATGKRTDFAGFAQPFRAGHYHPELNPDSGDSIEKPYREKRKARYW